MGYPRRVCAEALKQSNNRLEEASEMLLTNFDTLLTASRPAKEEKEDDNRELEAELMEDASHIPQLVALGAELEEARALLEIHGNRLDRAAEELLQKLKDPVTTDVQQSPMEDLLERARKIVEKRAEKKARTDEEAAAEAHRRATLQTVVPDLLRNNAEIEDSTNENQMDVDGPNDYLDLLLDEEETFICQYRQRLIDDGMW